MSILQSTRSRPLDPLLLDDGLVSGGSIPSAARYLGQTPESAMVNEIFNNPDAWNVQFGGEGHMDSAGPMDVGLTSGSSMGSSSIGKGFNRERRGENRQTSGSPMKKASRSVPHPEGYHLKRKSKLQLEAFTLKSFESRPHVTPHLSSASSMSDSSSLASSTPSLNSSLPTISDEDSVDSHPKSLELARSKWKGTKDAVDGRRDSRSLVALMEPSNTVSPEAGERVSILWSRQDVFHAFPSPKGHDFDFRDSQASAESASSMLAIASTLSRVEESQSSPGFTRQRRNVPSLKISTTTTMTTTTMTTVITVQSPEKTSPASVVLSASATWSILELYGDSPKPSPKAFTIPKTSSHLHSSFNASDLQLPPRIPLPKSAFASKFTSQQLNMNPPGSARIVELPADFVIPPLSRTKSKLKGPRMVPASPLRITMTKQPSPPPLPERESATLSRSRTNGKVRPLPKLPRGHSPPPPVPSLPSMPALKDAAPPAPKAPAPTTSSRPPAYSLSSMPSGKDTARPPQRGTKSALRHRIPPPPLPLDSPLPPLPSNAPDVAVDTSTQSKDAGALPVKPTTRSRTAKPHLPPHNAATTTQNVEVQSKVSVTKSEKDVHPVPTLEPVVRSRMPPPPPLSLDSPPLPPLPVDASPKSQAPDSAGSNKKEVLPVPTLEPPSSTLEPEMKAVNLQPLRLSNVISKAVPARPSRNGVVSPVPSPVLQKLNALDTLPGQSKLLSPPTSRHRSSASESSLGSAGRDTPSTSSVQLSAKKTLKKSLRTSSSFASLPKFAPDVPLPDASTLARRTRKDSVRPPLELDPLKVVSAAPKVDITAPEIPLVMAESSSSGPTGNEDISSSGSLSVAAFPSIPPSMEAATEIEGTFTQETTGNGSLPTEELSALPKVAPVQKPIDSSSSPTPTRAPASPVHRKGASLPSADIRPALKIHQKSSSSLSFKPLVGPLLPDVATLAKRLTTRKNSISTGFRPPFPEASPRLNSTSRDDRPPSDSMRHSRGDSSSSNGSMSIFKSSSEMVILYKPNAEQQVETSTDAPPRPPRRDLSTSSPLRPRNTVNASSSSASTKTIKRVVSQSSLQSPESSSPVPNSATLTMLRGRNASVSVRRPSIIDNAPLPDRNVLAQRVRSSSVLGSRPYSNVSDAFAPSTSSADTVDASSALPQTTRVASGSSTDVNVPLAAPKPVVAAGSWVPQLSKRLAEPAIPPTGAAQKVSNAVTIPGLAARPRARSMSGIKPTKVTAPPIPSLPSQTLRGSPSLQVPKAPLVSRTPSPVSSILVRNNTASPQPSMHVRFRSIDKRPLPAAVVPLVKNNEPVSQPSQEPNSESRRGGQRPTETPLIKNDEPVGRSLQEHSAEESRGRRTLARVEPPTVVMNEENRPSHAYERSTESSRGRQRTSMEVVSPRGRSASATRATKQPSTRKRAVSVAASPRKTPFLPPPPLPLSPDDILSADSLASAGSRGRISPFPSRPVSRNSARSGAF